MADFIPWQEPPFSRPLPSPTDILPATDQTRKVIELFKDVPLVPLILELHNVWCYIVFMKFSKHFNQMRKERNIRREWIHQTLNAPNTVEDAGDGTRHYIKQIPEYGNRWLRVVVNVQANPNRAVTAFFDRRLRRKMP